VVYIRRSTGQPRLQFRSAQNWADAAALSRGFMVVDSLTDSAFNSNRVLVAETVMMMGAHRRHVRPDHPRWAMGAGGSIQQNTTASSSPACWMTPADAMPVPSTGLEVTDCAAGELLRQPGVGRIDG
jgi:hypothetical protein